MTIDRLLNKASKLGAKGIEVVGYSPPKSPAEPPDGTLITIVHSPSEGTAATLKWYDK